MFKKKEKNSERKMREWICCHCIFHVLDYGNSYIYIYRDIYMCVCVFQCCDDDEYMLFTQLWNYKCECLKLHIFRCLSECDNILPSKAASLIRLGLQMFIKQIDRARALDFRAWVNNRVELKPHITRLVKSRKKLSIVPYNTIVI